MDKDRLTQVGRALDRLGIEHIPAYSPEARGRSERMFGTLQDRLVKELKLAGITRHRDRQPLDPRGLSASSTMPASPSPRRSPRRPSSRPIPALLTETLCMRGGARGRPRQHGRLRGLRLQLPESRMRAHYVKAHVKVRQYPDGTLAIFHGPRCLARYDAEGRQIAAPTAPSLASCSTPSRRGLDAPAHAAPATRRPALTASRHEANAKPWVGTKKRASRSNKETGPPTAAPRL